MRLEFVVFEILYELDDVLLEHSIERVGHLVLDHIFRVENQHDWQIFIFQTHCLHDRIIIYNVIVVCHEEVDLVADLLSRVVKHEGPGRPQITIEEYYRGLMIHKYLLDVFICDSDLGRLSRLLGPRHKLLTINGSIVYQGGLVKNTLNYDGRGGGTVLASALSVIRVDKLVLKLGHGVFQASIEDLP